MAGKSELWKSVRQKVNHTLGEGFWNEFSGIMSYQQPRTDVLRKGDRFYVFVELPGLASADKLKVSMQQQSLTIQGDIPSDYFDLEDDDMVLAERFLGPFRRTIELPSAIRPSETKASFQHGLLAIVLTIETAEAPSIQISITDQVRRE